MPSKLDTYASSGCVPEPAHFPCRRRLRGAALTLALALWSGACTDQAPTSAADDPELQPERAGPSAAASDASIDSGTSVRALPLEGVAQVEVARIYCGAVPIRCGTAVGPTLRYAVDLEAARLTTTRCFTPDAGAAAQPEVSRVVDAEQLRQVREALASVRVAEAEINALDGRMQTLSLTQSDGTVTRYSPEAACGERRYQQVVEGYAELWRVISSLDPE